ncbi:MAG: hypothetical protein ABJ246_20840 [Paracoccaceae bacterium]
MEEYGIRFDPSDQPSPFIVWTLRRTGGTTLNNLLMGASPFPTGLHEPFNHDREFGWVSQTYGDTENLDELRSNVGKVLDDSPLFKTAFEMQSLAINKSILLESTARGYRHIILDRKAEVDRLLSLELARVTGGWGKMDAERIYAEYTSGASQIEEFDVDWLVGHLEYCRKMRTSLQQLMIEAGIAPQVVYFEDIYLDHDAGRRQIDSLMHFVGLSPEEVPNYEVIVADALTFQGQNSARMMNLVPNIDDARSRLNNVDRPHTFHF